MRKTTAIIGSLILGTLALAACGDAADTQGRLVVLLTDAPGDFEQVPIEITAVQARYMGEQVADENQYHKAAPAGDQSQIQTQDGEQTQTKSQEQTGEGEWLQLMKKAQQQDLLQLQDGKTAAIGDVDVPGGYYDRVRLKLAKAQVVVDGETFDLEVPAEGIELAFKFQLKGGEGHEMTIDFDAKKSVQKKADGSGYELKPVVEVKQYRHTNRTSTGEGDGQGEPPADAECADGACQQGVPPADVPADGECKDGECQQAEPKA